MRISRKTSQNAMDIPLASGDSLRGGPGLLPSMGTLSHHVPLEIVEGKRCAVGWIESAVASSVGELKWFANGLMEAKEQILAYCTHGITSAEIEAFNASSPAGAQRCAAFPTSTISSAICVRNPCKDEKDPQKRLPEEHKFRAENIYCIWILDTFY